MLDLLDEIKEDLTREKYAVIWQKFGNYVIGGAIAALVLTAVGVSVNSYMNSQYSSYSDALYEASIVRGADAIKKYDDIIANANGTYKAIAGLRKASILLQISKNKEALDSYRKVIETSSSPQELKDIAKLLYIAVSTNLSAENKDYSDADAKKYLQENVDGKGVFKYSAMEISAFQEFDSRNYGKAKDIFNKLANSEDAPQNIKIRAKEMLDAIVNAGSAEQENVKEKKNG